MGFPENSNLILVQCVVTCRGHMSHVVVTCHMSWSLTVFSFAKFYPIVPCATRLKNRFISSYKKQRPLLSSSIKHKIIIILFCTLALVRHLSFQRSAIRNPFSPTVSILRQIPVPLPNHNVLGRHPVIKFVIS
jgi:hypothetical protein